MSALANRQAPPIVAVVFGLACLVAGSALGQETRPVEPLPVGSPGTELEFAL